MKKATHILSVLIVILFLISCNNKQVKNVENQSPKDIFAESLVETQILTNEYATEYEYTISIPPDYFIYDFKAADFMVYYIYPVDSVAQTPFSMGIYFGNHPNSFEHDCEKTTVENKILGENVEWTIYNCDTEYSTQALIESGSKEHWCEYIHLFGTAISESELEKLLTVFKTFSKSEKNND